MRTRAQVKTEDTWDLTPLFKTVAEWNKHYTETENSLDEISKFQGRLGESADTLFAAVTTYLDTIRQIERLYVYAHLRADEDTGNTEGQGLYARAANLSTRFSTLASFITPEFLELPVEKSAALLADPKLAPYKRFLNEIARYKPHTLSLEAEELLAKGGEVYSGFQKIFSQLNNADLNFGTVAVAGEERPLTHGTFVVFLRSQDREVRAKAYQQYYSQFEAHKNTIGSLLTASMKTDVYLASAKRYPSAVEQALFSDNVPLSVYDNLVATVSNNLPALHRYYGLRKKILNLKDAQIYDTYVPLVAEVETKIPYKEAAETVVEALKPLGTEYTSTLAAGFFNERWVDVYENKGKRSGAYSSGCYDSPPYMLMNYKEDNLHDMFTLAHEAGHSMHTWHSIRNQPYQDYHYTIFVAEVASTFNEQLLMKLMRSRHKNDKKMTAYLINQQLDDIKGTLYRQTMFAEFEREMHARIERNEAITNDTYKEIYQALLVKYFGLEVGIPDNAWLECLRIPHFYNAFYVYKYATGISAAIALSEMVLNGGEKELQRYLSFLKSGGTKFPIEQLQDAGVDLTTPAPIETALRLFDRLVGELEELLG